MKRTQVDRLVAYLREHPGASSLDLVLELGILNTTGRISDARKEGHVVDCKKVGGVFRYWLREAPRQLSIEEAVA